MPLPKLTIIGGGFAGIQLAKSLADAPIQITLIDKSNHHLFQPLLYQVATAGLSPANIAWPIRSIFRKQKNVRVVQDEVTNIDTHTQTIHAKDNTYNYDYLAIATGVTNGYFGRNEWAENTIGLKELKEATAIRHRILSAYEKAENTQDPEEKKALLTFAVIGGGPTGVELAGSIAELARRILPDDYRNVNPKDSRIVLIEAGDYLLSTFKKELSLQARRDLENFGVEVWMQRPVTNITPAIVETTKENLPTKNVFWAAGVQGTPVGEWLNTETDRMGRVLVDQHCRPHQPELLKNVFVMGDVANFQDSTNTPLPGVASVAIQQGEYVAKTIQNLIANHPLPQPFTYKDPGSMATIGRRKAIVERGDITMTGLLAWLAWLFIHVIKLMSFRNKILVTLQWIWAYFTFQRGARIIVNNHKTSSSQPITEELEAKTPTAPLG